MFIDSDFLNNNERAANIPRYQISHMGIVRHVIKDWSMEEFDSSLISLIYVTQLSEPDVYRGKVLLTVNGPRLQVWS